MSGCTADTKKFLLEEYSNISTAHFKSIESISSFFRYYLLIMSIPISAVLVLPKALDGSTNLQNFLTEYQDILMWLSTGVAFVGMGMFSYIINLRLDTILYARTVNSIRKYFYDSDDNLDLNIKLRMRTLPQSSWLPHYFEKSYFLPVVFVFFVVNTLYAIPLINKISSLQQYLPSPLPLACGISLSLLSHVTLYALFAHHREYAYLRSNIVGIDIDGVLNKHREHFCSILKKATGIVLLPQDILFMPVHENPYSHTISRDDERAVFNTPEYWTEMPIREHAAEIIRKIRNIFNSKIYIFTSRPWPDAKRDFLIAECKRKFCMACISVFFKKIFSRFLLQKIDPVKQLTKEWLRKHEFIYDRLIFEKGNDYTAFPQGQMKNRFQVSRKQKIRFFVEDDLEKAIKMSFISDVVFLINHPYNLADGKLSQEVNDFRTNIPSNIVRVDDWQKIYSLMRLYV